VHSLCYAELLSLCHAKRWWSCMMVVLVIAWRKLGCNGCPKVEDE